MAEDIVTTQQAEITQMQARLEELSKLGGSGMAYCRVLRRVQPAVEERGCCTPVSSTARHGRSDQRVLSVLLAACRQGCQPPMATSVAPTTWPVA